jgi:hypothetical protein
MQEIEIPDADWVLIRDDSSDRNIIGRRLVYST